MVTNDGHSHHKKEKMEGIKELAVPKNSETQVGITLDFPEGGICFELASKLWYCFSHNKDP